MFGNHDIGNQIKTTAGTLTIVGDPILGGEGAGYKATLNGNDVFYKEFKADQIANLSQEQVRQHRNKRTQWLVKARLDLLHPAINAPFAMTSDPKAAPGYVCNWVDSITLLSRWREGDHPYVDRLNVARKLGHLLSLIHARGVAQGDLNADNVGVIGAESSLEVVLIDFGNFNNGDKNLAPLMAGETEHMALWLQSRNGVPDIQSDVFAYGVMTHEMIFARNIDSGLTDREDMLARRELGLIPGDPLLGVELGADQGLPYEILPDILKTDLRNMLAPDPTVTPTIDSFLRHFDAEAPNLISCHGCQMPFWWASNRLTCPCCQSAAPAALNLRLSTGVMLPVQKNLMLGREQLGGAPYLSVHHLIVQGKQYGVASIYVRGRNGIKLIKYSGERMHYPEGSGPILVVPGDALELEAMHIDVLA